MVLASTQLGCGELSHTLGALSQPAAPQWPSWHGSAGAQEVPGLKSIQGSLSYWPQSRQMLPSQRGAAHSSVQPLAHCPLLQLVPGEQGTIGPHSRQPSPLRSPQVVMPSPRQALAPAAHSSLQVLTQAPLAQTSPSAQATSG